jgi:hypothetical protein
VHVLQDLDRLRVCASNGRLGSATCGEVEVVFVPGATDTLPDVPGFSGMPCHHWHLFSSFATFCLRILPTSWHQFKWVGIAAGVCELYGWIMPRAEGRVSERGKVPKGLWPCLCL